MNTALTTAQARLLRKPLDEFFACLSSPANLSKTLNRLLFEYLAQHGTMLPDEFQNLNALLDFLLACQVAHGATVIVAEA